jgi:putative transferase (TIGR04331 family)
MRDTKQLWFEEAEIVYGEVLDELITNLNKIHSVSFSKRFWDIFIGAWLREFVEIVMLQINECEKGLPRKAKPHNLASISSLVDYRNLSKTKYFVENLCFDTWSAVNNPSSNRAFQRGLANSKEKKTKKKSLGRNYCSATYLSRRAEVTLQIVSRRIPESLKVVDPPRTPLNHSLREAICDCNADLCQKSKIIYALIPKYLPNVYLESFSYLVATKKPWRGRKFPRVIFTANRHLYDDVFNYWTALATENGSKLAIGQHGGYYGLSEFPSSFERHEFDIADRYLSWGWNASDNSIAGPALILVNKRMINRVHPRSLIVVTDQLFTYPRSIFGDIDESSGYLPNIKLLVDQLTASKSSVLVRMPLTHAQSGRSQIDWFNEHLPQTAIDTGEQKFRLLLQEAKLVVIPHNGTTLIESIALGVPTVIFWDKSIVWMRSEAEAVFNLLEEAGVFHRTPESAASFINSIWDDVDGWWSSPATLEARKHFTDQYARTVSNPIRFLAKALQF